MEYYFSDKLASLKPSAIREIFKSLGDPEMISLAAGNPSPLSFPVEDLARISADIFANSAVGALQYGTTEGYAPLVKEVEKRMKEKFSIGREGDMTIITSGGQQGIELACKALCNEGDVVLCEDPTFIGALNAFRSCGAKTVGLPVGDDGIDANELDRKLSEIKNVKLIYLIPTFQNPGGFTTSLEKRKAIYEVAVKHGIMIIEDNPYGELRFAGEEVPTLKSMDTEGIVLYSSSFSKILSAGMRVGYMCGPEPVIQKMVVAKQSEDVHTNIFFQMLTYRFMTECDLDAHIAGIRKLYRDKCNLMLETLDRVMPDCVKYTRPEGGLFLWLTLPEEINMPDFVKKALEYKVAVVPGSTFLCDTNDTINAVRLNYSTPSDEDIVKGCELLGAAVKEMLNK
ncbi:MAG: PLP-dependent aminotransferase family protein [Ruminococcaceae bacterium]|nr:PLP-dependent aminotransferase family protein [Oscillospiraceae bacterium]